MGALLLTLIPLLSQLSGGAGIGAALHAVTLGEWIGIGVKAAAAGPDVVEALPKIWAAAHPALEALKPAFDQFLTDILGGRSPEEAAKEFMSQLAANADAAIALQPGIAGQ